MRIIIETTEAESRFTTVSHEIAGQPIARPQLSGQPAPQEPRALDGGPPAEALLQALGAMAELRTERTAGPGAGTAVPGGATDGGEPPSWLLNLPGGRTN